MRSVTTLMARILLIGLLCSVLIMAKTSVATEYAEENTGGRSEDISVEATVLMHPSEQTRLPAGDARSHVIGVGNNHGVAEFSDGRTATYSNVHFLDLFPGAYVNLWGYSKITFTSESWIYVKWTSRFTGLDNDGEPLFTGQGDILKGFGDYEGIQGSVKYSNFRIPPTEEFPKGARKSNAVFTYSLPKK